MDEPKAQPPVAGLILSPPVWERAILFSAAYFLCALAGSFLALKPGPFINFWPPSGLFVATLLRNERRHWPVFLLSVFPANIGFDLWNGQALPVSFLFCCGNCLEALAGAWLVRRFVAHQPTLASIREVLGLTFFSALLSTSLSATVGATVVTRLLGGDSFGTTWVLWWSSDVLGVLLLAPVILSWRNPFQGFGAWRPSAKHLEIMVFFLVLFLSASFILRDNWHPEVALKYLFIPFLIWAALRFGVQGTAITCLLVALLISWFTITGHSHIARIGLSPRGQVASLQLYLAVITLTGLLLAATLQERRREEEKHQTIIRTSMDAFWLVDLQGHIVDANPAASLLSGYSREELLGMLVSDIDQEEDLEAMREHVFRVREKGYDRFESRHRCKDGRIIDVEVSVNFLPVGEGQIFVFLREITERKQAEETLRKSETKFRELADSITDIFFAMDTDLRYTHWNKASELLTGIRMEEAVGKSLLEVFPDSPEIRKAERIYRDVVATQEARIFVSHVSLGEKRHFWEISAYPSNLGISVFVKDITERQQSEEALQAALREKEVMLKEIHHRVKNNLYVISSLLYFQSRQSQDKYVLAAFEESQARIQSMARLHEHLYQSKDLSRIAMTRYLEDLVMDLIQTYGRKEIQITVEAGDVRLDLDRALPSGLVVNELVSNALKYAFPSDAKRDGQPAEIQIAFKRIEGALELKVKDNGVGLPAGVEWEKSQTLGLRLVGMMTRQLEGTLEKGPGPGAEFTIRFPVPDIEKG